MNKLRKRINVMSLVLCALIPLSISAHKEVIVHAEDDFEIWDLKLSGMTEGKCKMFLKQTLIKKDKYKITGRFSGAIEDYHGGTGLLNCNLQGTIRKNYISLVSIISKKRSMSILLPIFAISVILKISL